MINSALKRTAGLWKRLLRTISGSKSQVEKIQSKRKIPLSSEKRAELEKLCDQLFQKKQYITSGKFQFIGMAKIRKRMGKSWDGLCQIVYEIAEDVIDHHTGPSDVYIRYKDDTYLLIFANANLEEGKKKAALIAEEIQRRLFAIEEDELKDIEIRKAIQRIRTDFLVDQDFPDFLDLLDIDWDDNESLEEEESDAPSAVDVVEVDTERFRIKKTREGAEYSLPDNLSFNYLPLWDVPRNALTTYFCLPVTEGLESNLFLKHKNFYLNLSPSQKVSLDLQTLHHTMAELRAMDEDGRQLLIACPVHYDTLYSFDNYELYKEQLEKIPANHKQYLIFVIMNVVDQNLPKNPYWFAAPLRAYCRHVFAEVPLRRDINFNYLRNTGVDVVGVRIESKNQSEQEVIQIINGFSSKAKSLKIPKTFIFGISSLSLTTSAVCAGFDFLGGGAIHDPVKRPDTIHRYRYEDLVKDLVR